MVANVGSVAMEWAGQSAKYSKSTTVWVCGATTIMEHTMLGVGGGCNENGGNGYSTKAKRKNKLHKDVCGGFDQSQWQFY